MLTIPLECQKLFPSCSSACSIPMRKIHKTHQNYLGMGEENNWTHFIHINMEPVFPNETISFFILAVFYLSIKLLRGINVFLYSLPYQINYQKHWWPNSISANTEQYTICKFLIGVQTLLEIQVFHFWICIMHLKKTTIFLPIQSICSNT